MTMDQSLRDILTHFVWWLPKKRKVVFFECFLLVTRILIINKHGTKFGDGPLMNEIIESFLLKILRKKYLEMFRINTFSYFPKWK